MLPRSAVSKGPMRSADLKKKGVQERKRKEDKGGAKRVRDGLKE